MPPTPVDDHTEEFAQLAGLAALDALDGAERDRFEAHAARCEVCRMTLQLDREALARAAPEMDPSPGFKARLMQRAAAELEAEQQQQDEPIRLQPTAKIIPFWRRTPRWASALAAVLVLGVFALGGYAYQNQVVAQYTLTGSVPGSAVVVIRRSGAAELQMRGVPPPSAGSIYEGWVIPPGGAPVSVGATPTGEGNMSLEQLPPGATVAVTEETTRVEAPAGPIVLKVQL